MYYKKNISGSYILDSKLITDTKEAHLRCSVSAWLWNYVLQRWVKIQHTQTKLLHFLNAEPTKIGHDLSGENSAGQAK